MKATSDPVNSAEPETLRHLTRRCEHAFGRRFVHDLYRKHRARRLADVDAAGAAAVRATCLAALGEADEAAPEPAPGAAALESGNGAAPGPSGPIWQAAAAESNWLLYRLLPAEPKPRKLPADPQSGHAPIAVYRAACLTLEQAQAAVARLGPGYGIGYLPRPGSALIGMDLDHAITDGAVEAWAKVILDVSPTWSEISPSGTGIRIIAGREPTTPAIDRERSDFGLFAGGSKFFTVSLKQLLPDFTRIENAPELVGIILEILEAVKPASDARGEQAPADDASHWFARLTEQRQLEEVGKMLGHLTDPKFGEYDTWLRISFAVHHATDSQGLEIWDNWCAQLPGYDTGLNEEKWNGFGGRNDVTVGTLIRLAREHGYRPPPEALRPPLPDVAAVLARYLRDRTN
jgi:Primase C terminal 2 (PriCT-2)